MREQGYHLVAVWLDETELAGIKRACLKADVRVATFLRKVGYKASLEELAAAGEPKPETLARAQC